MWITPLFYVDMWITYADKWVKLYILPLFYAKIHKYSLKFIIITVWKCG